MKPNEKSVGKRTMACVSFREEPYLNSKDFREHQACLHANLKAEIGVSSGNLLYQIVVQICHYLNLVDQIHHGDLSIAERRPQQCDHDKFTASERRLDSDLSSPSEPNDPSDDTHAAKQYSVSPLIRKLLQVSGDVYSESFDLILSEIARTSITRLPWPFLRFILVMKVESVLSSYFPRECSKNSLDSLRFSLGTLWTVGLAPLSTRRVCELLLNPTSNYKSETKFIYAIVRNYMSINIPLDHQVPLAIDRFVLTESFQEGLSLINPNPATVTLPVLNALQGSTDDDKTCSTSTRLSEHEIADNFHSKKQDAKHSKVSHEQFMKSYDEETEQPAGELASKFLEDLNTKDKEDEPSSDNTSQVDLNKSPMIDLFQNHVEQTSETNSAAVKLLNDSLAGGITLPDEAKDTFL